MKNIYKLMILFLVIVSHMWGIDIAKYQNAECTDRAYEFATKTTPNPQNDKKGVENERTEDLQYITGIGTTTCCCKEQILGLFKEKTGDITGRVNPAMDTLTQSLMNQLRASDIKILELVNLKYANTLYSFYDIGTGVKTNELNLKANDDGCQEAAFKFEYKGKGERAKYYRDGLLKEILVVLKKWKGISEAGTEKNIQEMVE